MTLIAVLVFMCLAAAAALAWPLLRGRDEAPARAAFDRTVLQEQLAELACDVDRGTIGATEARAARAEIERRALAVLADDRGPKALRSHRGARAAALAFVVALPTAAGLAYLLAGSPDLPGQPFAARSRLAPETAAATEAVEPPSPQALNAVLAMIEQRLAEAPDEIQGWVLLLRLYRRLGRGEEAQAAYAKALGGSAGARRAAIALAYGEAVVTIENGMITPAAKSAFDQALAAEPANPAARYYRGLALAQGGDPKAALMLWRELDREAPADAPWRPGLRENIDRLEREGARR